MRSLFIRSLHIDWTAVSSDSYLRKIPVLQSLEDLAFHAPVTFFSGENGSGKSTLLEAMAIAYGFNPEGGTRNYAFSTKDSHSELFQAMTLIKGAQRPEHGYFLRAESFYNVATMEEEYSRDTQSGPEFYHCRSHGESFLSVMEHHFAPHGIYFLDEPEAALSPQRQMSLLAMMHTCVKEGAQFFVVTHSPILLACPDAEILAFNDTIEKRDYEQTDSYHITKMFIENRENILHHLFTESGEENHEDK